VQQRYRCSSGAAAVQQRRCSNDATAISMQQR
jgi:hypothetical protein